MPEAEASTNSQAAHCKRSAAGKADIALQPRMEPACSNADTACLFQVLGRVHNCTPFSRKRQRNGIHCRGSAWLKALFCLGQTFQVAECDKRPFSACYFRIVGYPELSIRLFNRRGHRMDHRFPTFNQIQPLTNSNDLARFGQTLADGGRVLRSIISCERNRNALSGNENGRLSIGLDPRDGARLPKPIRGSEGGQQEL
jgi:hypothetical protein